MQPNVIRAVIRRELASFFSNPTGYVFITLFVFLSGVAAFWVPAFFERNLATLDQLNSWFPLLLVFLAPAITMTTWSEERRQGTEELLLTLPARDTEIIFGKFLGCFATYLICLAFALSHVFVLSYLGRPDIGLIVANFVGYALAGAAMIAVSLAAGTLSRSPAVSYIAGAVTCGVLATIGWLAELLPSSPLPEVLRALSVPDRLDPFAKGVVTLPDTFYFLSLAAAGVWLAVHLISQPRFPRVSSRGAALGHTLVRLAAVLVACGAGVAFAARVPARLDATSERLWSLSTHTRSVIAAIPADKPVTISAYLSPTVPQSYVQTRATLEGLLREIAAVGGSRIRLQITPTEPFTKAAAEADRAHAFKPRSIPADTGPAGSTQDVFLALAITGDGGQRTALIPFLSRGLPVEYELARSIRSVSAPDPKRVAVIETGADLFARFDFTSMRPTPDWPVITELRKQYQVVNVAQTAPIPEDADALLVLQPSTVSQECLDRILAYARAGRPLLVLEDPMPLIKPEIATSEPPQPPQRGMPPPAAKPDLAPLWDLLGASVSRTEIVWDSFNPHPELAQVPPEFIWVTSTSGLGGSATADQRGFNESDPITAGLQECVLLFPGAITRRQDTSSLPLGVTVTPLLRSSPTSGQMAYADILDRDIFGIQGLNPDRRPRRLNIPQSLAVRVRGVPSATPPAPPASPEKPDAEAPTPESFDAAKPPAPASGAPVNAVLIADLDFVSESFFSMRENGVPGMEFDNITFILNAIDDLTGDAALVELRKRRPAYRTLQRMEAIRQAQALATLDAIGRAEADAGSRIAEAQGAFDASLKQIEARADLDETTKRIMTESVRRAEQRRLDAATRQINQERERAIADARLAARQEIDSVQMTIRAGAVALPPVPAIALGLIVAVRRRARESARMPADTHAENA